MSSKQTGIAALVVIVIALLAAWLGGFFGQNGQDPERIGLTLVVREGLEADGLEALALAFAKAEGIDVTVERVGRENYEGNVVTDITNPSPAYDVAFLPGTLIAELADKDALAPLSGLTDDDRADFLDIVEHNGSVYAVPTDVSTFYFIYRNDLLEAAPATWNEVVETKSVGFDGDENTRHSFAFAGRPGEELPKIFYPFLWSHGGFILKDGQVGLAKPEAVAAAELFAGLTQTRGFPEDINTWEVGRILDELNKGQLASTGPQWNAVYPLVQDSDIGKEKGFTAVPLPGVKRGDGTLHSVNFMHFWTLAASARRPHPEMAGKLIRFLTSKKSGEEYAKTWQGTPARRSVLNSVDVLEARPDLQLLSECLEDAKAEPNVPYYAKMHRIMNDALSLLLSGEKSAERAMTDAADDIRRLISDQ